jgi:hypothetical protein
MNRSLAPSVFERRFNAYSQRVGVKKCNVLWR